MYNSKMENKTDLFDVDLGGQGDEKRRLEMEQRMAQIAKEREMARKEVKQEANKDKDPDEDFKNIDQKFQQALLSIQVDISKWQQFPEDKPAVEKHFDELFNRYKELREYIANYSYSLPVYLLSGI